MEISEEQLDTLIRGLLDFSYFLPEDKDILALYDLFTEMKERKIEYLHIKYIKGGDEDELG